MGNGATYFNLIRTFSATKQRDRDELGDKISKWLATEGKDLRIIDKVVTQSSDNEFHCLTITLFLRAL